MTHNGIDEKTLERRLALERRNYKTYRRNGEVYVEDNGKIYRYHKTMRGYQLDPTKRTPKDMNDEVANGVGHVEEHVFSSIPLCVILSPLYRCSTYLS